MISVTSATILSLTSPRGGSLARKPLGEINCETVFWGSVLKICLVNIVSQLFGIEIKIDRERRPTIFVVHWKF